MFTGSEVEAAAARIAGHIRRTPVMAAGPGLFMKLEHVQHTGSFKARGAFNRILSAREHGELPESGVIAASGGNAGVAVAHAAAALGVVAEVFVPETAPEVKVRKLAALGARVRQVGRIYGDAYEAAIKRVADTGALLCHAYDQPEICAGQGTSGLELLAQTGGVDTVLIAVGGGGLMAGVATAVEGRAKVVGVEPERIPTLHRALEAGAPVDVEVGGLCADSLGATRLGDIAFEVAVRTGVESLLVADEDIAAARRALWDEHRLVVEHGTAAALAALATGAYRPEPGERVAVMLCGANTDPSDLAG
ncbi:threonine/serine dehydratase [Actinomadura sp. HBU206391]|uniref:threonine/serine dehydratase n=1 Tax=Actinomadura sp. HBU206391 TaxID=2731692 RepID=UPI00164F92DD|nr:threonine/serine dehydratase [Actinomadura sp. HBU206391]MBC6460651.1 threonine/serine dehydratase [Actinomadura sp. HBU206391]